MKRSIQVMSLRRQTNVCQRVSSTENSKLYLTGEQYKYSNKVQEISRLKVEK